MRDSSTQALPVLCPAPEGADNLTCLSAVAAQTTADERRCSLLLVGGSSVGAVAAPVAPKGSILHAALRLNQERTRGPRWDELAPWGGDVCAPEQALSPLEQALAAWPR